MSAALLLAVVIAYFALLFGVAHWASRRGGAVGNEGFFVGNRKSPWLLVAFGMIGTSLSGVTFISVPGGVGSGAFAYFQIALGQTVGYALIAFVLLPLYYRLKVTSIYEVLATRLGGEAQRTGSMFFLVSRLLGATARLYLVARVLHDGVLQPLVPTPLPFFVTAFALVAMVWLYTREGGVKAIVWTDTLQTSGMLIGLVACSVWVLQALNMDLADAWHAMTRTGLNQVIHEDPMARNFWIKQFLAGMAIAVAMTGLDQEMMQKNLSVPRLADAQKNVLLMSALMLGVVFLFLWLGGLLHLFAAQAGITARGDALFPTVVLQHLPLLAQIVFVLALVSALLPSADGALTALTASTCLDLLRSKDRPEAEQTRLRTRVHLAYAAAFLLLVMLFRWVDNPNMILLILKLAGYTYGPLLGLFLFAMTASHRQTRAVLPIALTAPLLCWLIDRHQAQLFGGWQIGLELLLLNAALTYAGLWLASKGRHP
ncbi:sodium:solute symporter [Inhella sp.]|uniref:sodium:solute symporter n=1 Tax=Inhella sp. TaxID=1921806 RepID=UPI0035B3CACC